MIEPPDQVVLVVPLIAGGVALAAGYLAARDLERRGGLGMLDGPGERKPQQRPVPLAGGVALLLAVALVMLLARGFKLDPHVPARLLLAPLGGFVVGLADDLRGKRLGAGTKAAATLLCLAGASPPGTPIGERIGWIAVAFVAMHALNTIDHVNGLAGFVAAAGALALSAAAALRRDLGVAPAVLAAAVAGAAAGFLFLNFPRGRVFLGDSGTLLLGGALAALLLAWRRPELLLFAAVPIADLLSVACLRLLAGAKPWVGDRRHVTHRLAARGLPEARAVLGLAMVQAGCSAAGACALASGPAPGPVLGMGAAWTLALGVISVLAVGMLCVRPR